MPSFALLGALMAMLLAWLLFRDAEPTNEDAWEGVALERTAELLAAPGDDAAQAMADLWQLDAEHDAALESARRATGDER
jgi:hypothetical protein